MTKRQQHPPPTVKPGQKVPDSGIYRAPGGRQSTLVRGARGYGDEGDSLLVALAPSYRKHITWADENAGATVTLQERLRQMSKFHIDGRECAGGKHITWADESAQAADRIDALELALYRIAGHGNITGDKAREIACEALGIATVN